MKIRTRLIIFFAVIAAAEFYALIHWIVEDLHPRYQATMEESMVDTVNLLASMIENDMAGGEIDISFLHEAFSTAGRRLFAAQIYEMTKTRFDMRVYVTDQDGIVLFDSDGGRDEGKDYSRWNDVARTLQGRYGARATRRNPEDPMSSVLHVAAPIRANGEIVGVLTIGKPADSISHFLLTARYRIILLGVFAAVSLALLGAIVSFWVTWPLERLTAYTRAVRDGRRVRAPLAGSTEIGALIAAFEEMRTALEGKQYIEHYVQDLTHEMKSPLSAIRGAAELLEEDLPPEARTRFLANLRTEAARLQELVDRMLQLAAVESRKGLRDVESISLPELLEEVGERLAQDLAGKQLALHLECPPDATMSGERFLLRQALLNLLRNAIDFSEKGAQISVKVSMLGALIEVAVEDAGPGVPAYAVPRVFDRFYSLPRPGTGQKSSGLGLPFVREVAELHGGNASIQNRPEGGVRAAIALPVTRAAEAF